MGLPGISTTADPIIWEEAIMLYKSLIDDKQYRLAVMVIIGIYTGLRISDIRDLTWENILYNDCLIQEHKTGKGKNICLSEEIKNLLKQCYHLEGDPPIKQHFLLSQKRTVFSIQQLNRKMKDWKNKYNLNINNISTHSLRKTMAVRLLNVFGNNLEGLKVVQGALNHDTLDDTLRYLGIPLLVYKEWQEQGKIVYL
jgi:integrase